MPGVSMGWSGAAATPAAMERASAWPASSSGTTIRPGFVHSCPADPMTDAASVSAQVLSRAASGRTNTGLRLPISA